MTDAEKSGMSAFDPLADIPDANDNSAMRVASAILKSGRVYMQGYAQTTAGVWIGRGPVHVASISSAKDMGANIRASLTYSIQGVSHPDKAGWKDVQQPMLEAGWGKELGRFGERREERWDRMSRWRRDAHTKLQLRATWRFGPARSGYQYPDYG